MRRNYPPVIALLALTLVLGVQVAAQGSRGQYNDFFSSHEFIEPSAFKPTIQNANARLCYPESVQLGPNSYQVAFIGGYDRTQPFASFETLNLIWKYSNNGFWTLDFSKAGEVAVNNIPFPFRLGASNLAYRESTSDIIAFGGLLTNMTLPWANFTDQVWVVNTNTNNWSYAPIDPSNHAQYFRPKAWARSEWLNRTSVAVFGGAVSSYNGFSNQLVWTNTMLLLDVSQSIWKWSSVTLTGALSVASFRQLVRPVMKLLNNKLFLFCFDTKFLDNQVVSNPYLLYAAVIHVDNSNTWYSQQFVPGPRYNASVAHTVPVNGIWPPTHDYETVHVWGKFILLAGGHAFSPDGSTFSSNDNLYLFDTTSYGWTRLSSTGEVVPGFSLSINPALLVGNTFISHHTCSSARKTFKFVIGDQIFAKNIRVSSSALNNNSISVNSRTVFNFTTNEVIGAGNQTQFGKQLKWGNNYLKMFNSYVVTEVKSFTAPPSRLLSWNGKPLVEAVPEQPVANNVQFPAITEIGNGVYQTNIRVQVGSAAKLFVTFDNTPVTGSPFVLTMTPGAVDLSKSVFYGQGVMNGKMVRGEKAAVFLQTFDSFGNQLQTGKQLNNMTVLIQQGSACYACWTSSALITEVLGCPCSSTPSSALSAVEDLNDGSYQFVYIVPSTESFKITVYANGKLVVGPSSSYSAVEQWSLNAGFVNGMSAIGIVSIILCAAVLVAVALFRNSDGIQMMHPSMLMLSIIGATISCVTPILLTQQSKDNNFCSALPFIRNVGFATMFYPIAVMLWRISSLQERATKGETITKASMPADHYDWAVVPMIAIELIFQIIWNAIAPLSSVREEVPGNFLLAMETCQGSDYQTWMIVSLVMKAPILAVLLYQALKNKEIPAILSISKFLFFVAVNSMTAIVVVVPASILLAEFRVLILAMQSVATCEVAVVSCVLLASPLLLHRNTELQLESKDFMDPVTLSKLSKQSQNGDSSTLHTVSQVSQVSSIEMKSQLQPENV